MSASASSNFSSGGLSTDELRLSEDFIQFLNESPSAFHATTAAASRLKAAGFQCISERDNAAFSSLQPNGKYYFTRNQSSIIAFAVGGNYTPKDAHFMMIGAHTDSPVLKLKPVTKIGKQGFIQLDVEPYGGGLWHTWFDRDLSIAGRVLVEEASGETSSKLVRISRPLLRVPMLAIHLQRDIGEKGFNPNKQTHLLPILATQIKYSLAEKSGAFASTGVSTSSSGSEEKKESDVGDHHPLLLHLLANELKVSVQFIRDFELNLYDTQPAGLIGAFNEFISSARLDNLGMSYISIRSLVDSLPSLNNDKGIRFATLFDNEEVGSDSLMGAGSNLMHSTLTRIVGTENIDAAIRRSLLISADMAHAVHPNYSEVHEENHRPQLHKGLVVKVNQNQRYATHTLSAFHINEVARQHKLSLQKFAVRNDSACGSTIGPILATNTGIRTVDVGIPQLSMHSIRETCATADVLQAYQLFVGLFKAYREIDEKLKVDGEQ